jgi:hypothetical protein
VSLYARSLYILPFIDPTIAYIGSLLNPRVSTLIHPQSTLYCPQLYTLASPIVSSCTNNFLLRRVKLTNCNSLLFRCSKPIQLLRTEGSRNVLPKEIHIWLGETACYKYECIGECCLNEKSFSHFEFDLIRMMLHLLVDVSVQEILQVKV